MLKLKSKVAIVPYSGAIPCQHEDISLMGCNDGCEIETEWELENECGAECPDYKPRLKEVCKKHHIEYVGECDSCFGDYWEKAGKRQDRQWAREEWCAVHLYFTLKYTPFDWIGCWVIDNSPRFKNLWKFDMGGRLWRGFEITMLSRSLRLNIYKKGEYRRAN